MKSWVNPRWRVLMFVVVANATWMFAAWAWTERETWLWITPVALSINFLLLTYDQVLNFSKLETQALVGHDGWGLLKTVHELSEQLKMPAPQVFLIENKAAQVFSYSRTKRHSRLFVTEGALRLLSAEELRTVLTYQLLATRHSVTVMNYWVGALLDLVYRVGRAFERSFAFVFGWSPRLAAWLMRPALGLMQLLLLSRGDFQRLDQETAKQMGESKHLASALWKMESYAQTCPWADAWVFAHMCIVSPLQLREVLGFFRIQPAVKGRIKTLTGRYPL